MYEESVEDIVLFSGILCKMAYQADLRDLSIVKDEILSEHLEIFNESTYELIKQHCWIIKNDQQKSIYIAVRGTDSQEDTLLNFYFFTDCFNVALSELRVHAGYMKYYRTVSEKVFKAIEEFKIKHENKDVKVIVTGHSLGGAAAILCSLDLIYKKKM
jgi:predicted lipase